MIKTLKITKYFIKINSHNDLSVILCKKKNVHFLYIFYGPDQYPETGDRIETDASGSGSKTLALDIYRLFPYRCALDDG